MEILRKYKKALLAIGVVLILVIGILSFSNTSNKPKTQSEDVSQKKTTEQNQASSKSEKSQAPTISFSSFAPPPAMPQVPQVMTIYKLKGMYSVDEVRAFAAKFGFDQYKERNYSVLLFNTDEQSDKNGYMIFDRESGKFSFYSYGNHVAANSAGKQPVQIAQEYINTLGIADQTITCPITYQRKDENDITYVECHRDWQKVGMPILNMVGLLNLEDTEDISSLALGMVDQNAPVDDSIINTSTNQDGRKRPSDFNTITVAVGPGGKINMIQSNIRQVETTMQVASAGEMVSPKQAWEKFQKNQSDVSFVAPAGQGTIDWTAIFPNNVGTSQLAQVSAYKLVYLENSVTQHYLTPMYIVRGNAQTDTGYAVNFIEGVAATKIGLSAATTTYKAVAGISDSTVNKKTGIQLKTFSPPTAPPSPTSPQNPGNAAGAANGCLPGNNQIAPQQQLASVGTIGPWTIAPFAMAQKRKDDYFLLTQGTGWPDPGLALQEFSKTGLADKTRKLSRVLTEIQSGNDEVVGATSGGQCPLRISGSSPTLFFYGPDATEYTVSSSESTTYTYPATNKNDWNVTLADGLATINGLQTAYAYYEYSPIAFTKQKQGWLVRKNDLGSFVNHTLSPALRLNLNESERLVFELNHAASKTHSQDLFIGLIPESELNEKLPLTVSPQPEQIVRYHFQVSDAASDAAPQAPRLTPLSRTSTLILELGAAYSK